MKTWNVKRSYSLAFTLVGLTLFAGCSIDSAINQLQTPNLSLKQHEILEVKPDVVLVEVLGICPKDSTNFNIAIKQENQQISSKSVKKDFDQLVPGELISECNPAGELKIVYAVPQPDQNKKLEFEVAVNTNNAVSEVSKYPLDYVRPEVPRPLLQSHPQATIYTNQSSLSLNGICVAHRLTGLKYRRDGGAWTDLTCTRVANSGTWTLSLSGLTETSTNPYSVELRAENNTSSPTRYSDILNITVHVDFTLPTTLADITGVLNQLEAGTPSAWTQRLYPIVAWNPQPEHHTLQLQILTQDLATIICPAITVPNDGKYEFTSETCNSALSDGQTYTVVAKGQDRALNLTALSDSFEFTIDRSSPSLAWAATPSALSVANFAEFDWTASAGSGSPLTGTYTCSLNGAPSTTCNPVNVVENLATGTQSFTVSTQDLAGNIGTLTYNWTIQAETNAPTCTLTSADQDWVKDPIALTFSCTDDNGMRKAQCRVDSSTWGDCNSLTGHTITGLQDGERKIEIRGIDIAGNASNILIEDVRVDNSGPLVTFITTPASTTSLVSADFSFNVFDPGSDVATVECQLDGGAFSACTSPYFIAGPLNEGAHQFVVKATDNLGNEGFSTPFNWNVDLTSPFAPIFDANEDGPRRPTWEWTSGGGGGIGSYRFKLNDNDLSSGSTTQNATSFTPSYDLSFGTHTLYTQESDAAGNWSPSGSKSFYIKCSQGEYLDGGNCQVCPTGTYQESPSLNSTCTTTPQGSYIAVTGASAPSACPFNSNTTGTGATSLADCLGNAGYFNCEDGICNPVGAPFFSPTLSNTRTACPTNQYTAGSGTDADDITDCRAGLDFYDHDSDPATAAIAVGNGFYSAYRVNTRDVCTNKPANATVVLYSGSGAGSNNCPISAVVDCSPGFIPNGTTCFDNSPSAIHFTNLNNQERNTLTESNTVVVNGFDGPLDATCSGCSGIARNGVWGGTSVSGFMPGDTLSIRLTTSNSFSTDVLATVTLGSTTSSNWLVGTRAAYDCNDANIGLVAHGASANAYSEATPLPGTSCESIKEVRSCFDGSLSGTLTHPTCQEGCGSTIFGDLRSGEGGTAYSTQTPAGTCASVSQTRTCNNGVLSGSFAQTTCFNACNSGSFVNIPHGTSVNAYSVSAIYSGTCDPYKEVRTCTNGTLSGSYANATCTLGHIVATGGAISDINVGGRMYRVHSFTNVGSESFNVTQIGALGGTVEYLIVAGGGGGGGRGGGGGAGGVITGATSVGVANYTVTVGGGGRGEGNGGSKTNGGNSSAIGLTAIGGGAGGNYHLGAGNSGGSGGGTGGGTDTSAGSSSWGAGTAGQGYRGGGTGTNSYAGGGGGGAGGAGGTSGPAGNGVGGNGGPGIASSIRTGANQWYGGGGGGAGIAGGVAGAGGSGGGGNGGHPGQNAAANTGGGGGGSGSSGGVWTAGGNGGSGIVIIRYPLEP